MRIVIEAQSLLRARTGVGQYTYHLIDNLIPLLAKKNIDLSLFYFNFLGRNREIPRWNGSIQVREQTVLPGRCFYFLWKKGGFPPLNWLAGKADLFHFPNFIARPLTTGKAVATLHDLSFVRYPEFAEKKNLQFLKHWIPATLERAAKILVVSEFTKKELMEIYRVPEGKIAVTLNGVGDEFAPVRDPRAIEQVKEKYRLPPEFVLAVGTLEPRKNLAVVIQALAQLKRAGKEAPPLILIGAPGWNNEAERLQKLAAEEGLQNDLKFLFYVDRDDMPAIYSAAKFLVFPSLYEGFGLPVLEAMACGTPVVASDVSSIPEVGGVAPLYVWPSRPELWAERIWELWQSEAKQEEMRARGLEQARKFTWRQTAQKTLEAYEQALRD